MYTIPNILPDNEYVTVSSELDLIAQTIISTYMDGGMPTEVNVEYIPYSIREAWIKSWGLESLIRELDLAINDVYPQGAIWDGAPREWKITFLEILRSFYSQLTQGVSEASLPAPKAEIVQDYPDLSVENITGATKVVIYDTKSELIKYLVAETPNSLFIKGKKVCGYDLEKSWIKIAKGQNLSFCGDVWNIVETYKAKHWPPTGKLGETAIILAIC
jgi:hypothetical protein